MADKLLPCPFCGGNAKLVIDLAQTKDPVYCFECEDCGVLVYMDDLIDKDKSIEAWNNRPSHWHTGTPTEEGWYLLECNIGNSDGTYYATDYWNNEVGYWTVNRVIRWQKIDENKEANNGTDN